MELYVDKTMLKLDERLDVKIYYQLTRPSNSEQLGLSPKALQAEGILNNVCL